MGTMKRRLTIIGGTSPSFMDVDVSAPKESGEQDFVCRYALHWPSGTKEGAVYGIDALQALYLTFNAVAVRLYTSELHKQKKLFWETLGDGYGFPLSANVRDLAEGADRSL